MTREEGSRTGSGSAVGRPVKSDEALMSSFRPSRCCSERETASTTSAAEGKSRYANLRAKLKISFVRTNAKEKAHPLFISPSRRPLGMLILTISLSPLSSNQASNILFVVP